MSRASLRAILRKRISFDPDDVVTPPHDPRVQAFFGAIDPPHELVLRRI